MFAAAACMTFVPTSVEPVKEIFATLGSEINPAAVVDPGPGSTLSAPFGRPHSVRIPAIARAVSGVWDAGLTMAVLPHASAGAIFQLAITAGKFQGVMSTHTPTGSRSVTSSPGGTIGMVSPRILFAAPPQYSKTLATMSDATTRCGPKCRRILRKLMKRRPTLASPTANCGSPRPYDAEAPPLVLSVWRVPSIR